MMTNHEPSEGLRALARKLDVDPTLEAIAEHYRRVGLPRSDDRFARGGPECQADRDKAIQRHRRERRLAERKTRMGTKDMSPEKLAGLRKRAEQGRLAKEAKAEAREQILERHADEFDELLRKARVARGLPETPPLPAQSKLEALREQLRAAGIEPTV